jgi:quinohemoprotein ethanol dehydrogenase|nr:MAG: quinonprotein alcohol dehydrogenase [Pseudomonadota bacterium]
MALLAARAGPGRGDEGASVPPVRAGARPAWMGVLCLMGLLHAPAFSQAIRPAPAFTPAELSAPPTTGWLTNGGNLFNQRYSPLAQINRDNVAQLKAKWRTHLAGSGLAANHSGQGQPIVHDGVIYITTGPNDVFAVSVETGAILWSYRADLDPARVRACCGWVNRGAALGDGKVFIGRLDAMLVALDQRTGREVWKVQAEDPLEGFSITAAPLYYDGLVIIGFAGGEAGIRGRIKAYDARTGGLVWTFYTIPGPGEFGHHTWPQDNDAWKYGGAPIWQTPALDPGLGLLYFATGNAGPDYNGANRAGDNLFTVSILALEVKTGKYRWHFQQVHHDIWDYDAANPVILFDAPYGGRMRKGLAQAGKTGWVYILDRETGEPLVGIEERSVPQEPRQKTAATQPFVTGDAVVPQFIDIAPEGFELVNQGRIFTPFWDEVVLYKPQMGVNWPPSSYDPTTYRMFICGSDHVGVSASDGREDFFPPAPDRFWAGGRATANHGVPRRGIFTAMDLRTNRIVWNQQWSTTCMNGTLATGGGLVFVGRADGRFTALDSSNGRRLWQFQTDAGVAAPASTFEYEGRQYVAVLSAGTMFNGGKRGDSLWLFSLDGTIESLPVEAVNENPGAPPNLAPPGAIAGDSPAGAANAPARSAPVAVTLPAGPANLAEGARLYRQFCVACHGENGRGGQAANAASLEAAARDLDALAATAWNGRNTMPAFRGTLTPGQLRDVSHYIRSGLFDSGHGD